MKKYIFYTIATVVTFLTFSCSKDTEVQTPDKPLPVDPIVPTEKSVVLSGTVDATKVSSDNNGAYKWQASDIITILTNKGTNREFTAGEAGISTDFSGHIPDADVLEGGFALYPASENHSISGTTITFNMPSELAWGADASYMPMYAPITMVEQKPSASFKAVGGALKLILYNIPSGATYLAFTAASVNIAGDFSLDTTAETPVISGGKSKEIDINFSDNYSANKVFYIPLPPVTLTGGFTISIFDDEANELFSVTSTKAVPIARNQLVVAKPLNCTRTLWHEDFSQYSKDDVPGAKSGENYHGATGYACVDGNSSTKIWEQSVAGGTSPEILIGKSGGYFTATGINCSGINTMAITFKKNGNALTVSATDGITISGSTLGSGTKTLTLTNNSLSSFDLTFSAGSDNVRLDDIVLSTIPEAFTAPTISAGAEELTIGVGQSSASTTASLANEVDELGINWKFSGANADKFEATLDNTTLTVTAKETNTSASDYTATLTLKATGAVSKEIAITQKTNVVPNPTVTVTPGDSKFTATWTADENATSYVAYLHTAATENPAEDGTNITSSISNSGSAYSITDYPATNGTGYHLYIKVNGVNEGYSAHSGYAESTFTPSTTIVWDLQSIAVTHAPTKTVYSSGEYFNPAGLEVTATFEEQGNTSNTREEVVNNNDLTFSPSTSTALTPSDNSVTISYTVGGTTKTTSQAIGVDCVALDWSYPASWTDGTNATSNGLTAISGVTASGLGDYADNDNNRPYLIKLDNTEDNIVIKTDSVIGAVSVKYKMIGGANTSSILFQESSNGESYTDVETLSISGNQGSTGVLTTTASFKAASRYVKLVFTKGSNVGIGGISITKGDTTVWDLKSIAVTTPPTKTSYEAGETFDPTGMVVTATYQDQAGVKADKTEPIANGDLTFSPDLETALTTDDESVSISYGGQSTTQSITVTASVTWDLKSIAVTTAPTKTTYTEGDTFDPAGMVVTAHYEDHNDNTNTKDEIVSNGDLTFSPSTSTALTTSDVSVTITYNGKSTTQSITVNVAVNYVKVTSLSNVTAGEYIIVNDGYYLPNAAATSSGPSKVAVTISNDKVQNVTSAMTWTFTGSASAMTIQSTADNTKYLYVAGASGNNQLRVNTTSDHTWTIADYSGTPGAFTMKDNNNDRYCATYSAGSDWRSYNTYNAGNYGDGGRVYLYKLEDNTQWNLKSIAVTTPPTKTTYEAGENFDPTGMVVTATYEDQASVKADKTEPIANGDLTFSPSTSTALTTDDESVSISYGGQSTTQSITVTAPVTWDLKSIAVKTSPTKVSYTVGEYFDPAGLVLTATYEADGKDDKTEDVEYNNGNASEFIFSPTTSTALITSHTSVSITWGEKSTSQAITVSDPTPLTEGNPWYYTFTNNPFSNNSATLIYSSTSLTWSTTDVATSYTNDALSFGTNNNPAAATLSTSSYTDGVSIIEISIKGNSNKSVTAAISVGGTALKYKGQTSVTQTGNTLTSYEFVADELVSGQIQISFTNPNGGYQIKSIKINPEPVTLSSISISGQKTSFNVGDEFSFGGTVTAHYSDESTANVTNAATFSGYNLSSAGEQTVTVSYTEDNINRTITYNITVNEGGGGGGGDPVTVTFTAGTDTGATSVTKDGITVSMSTMSRDDNYRTYGGTDMTVSAANGKTITQIVLTCTANGSASYGPGKFSGEGYTASNGKTGTWTGTAQSVTLQASNQVRMTAIEVTYN